MNEDVRQQHGVRALIAPAPSSLRDRAHAAYAADQERRAAYTRRENEEQRSRFAALLVHQLAKHLNVTVPEAEEWCVIGDEDEEVTDFGCAEVEGLEFGLHNGKLYLFRACACDRPVAVWRVTSEDDLGYYLHQPAREVVCHACQPPRVSTETPDQAFLAGLRAWVRREAQAELRRQEEREAPE